MLAKINIYIIKDLGGEVCRSMFEVFWVVLSQMGEVRCDMRYAADCQSRCMKTGDLVAEWGFLFHEKIKKVKKNLYILSPPCYN